MRTTEITNHRFLALLVFLIQVMIFLIAVVMNNLQLYPGQLFYYIRRFLILFKSFILVGRHLFRVITELILWIVVPMTFNLQSLVVMSCSWLNSCLGVLLVSVGTAWRVRRNFPIQMAECHSVGEGSLCIFLLPVFFENVRKASGFETIRFPGPCHLAWLSLFLYCYLQ